MDDIKLLIPGAIQGFVRSLISYPFEVIKTQMQINNTKMINTVNNIILNDKYKFYRGIGIPLIQIPLERSIQFYIYEKSKKYNNIFLSSLFTSFFTNTLFAPLSIMQINIISSNKNMYKNIKHFIINSDKKKIFYKGISLEISKNYISTFIYFYLYSYFQKNLKINNYYKQTFISGILSSIGVWLIVLPYDTIKVKYQTSNNSLKNIILNINSKNITNLWKGITPIFIRTIPSSGFGMIVYEFTKNKLLPS